VKQIPCPVCRSQAQPSIRDLYDDRYGYSGLFTMYACRDCGHRHLAAQFEPRQLTRLYSQFYPRSQFSLDDFKAYPERDGLAAWWNGERSGAYRWVPKGVRVLDIGCGFGQTLAYHQARGCEVWGVEADENIRRVADRFGFKVHVGLFDASLYEPDYFDYVTLDQVIEHSTDPGAMMRGVARVLRRGGRAILTTPNAASPLARILGRRWLHWHTPYHLQFFSQESMRLSAAQAGLQVDRRVTVASSEWLHYQWLHFFALPGLGARSAFWCPGVEQHLMYRYLRRPLAAAHRWKINHLVTRAMDALGMGDNQIFFLRRA
jgi:SAM-dependent methyltransferase